MQVQVESTSKDVTCATILLSQDKKRILVGKITLQEKYDLPKGKNESNETELQTAIRELYEETGLLIDKSVYEKYLKFKVDNMYYNKEKNISLFFVYDENNEFINNENLKNLTCNTYFTIDKYKDRNQVKDIDNDNNDKKYPEISGYRTVNINTVFFDVEYAKKIFNKSMVKILRSNKFRTHLNNFINSLA